MCRIGAALLVLALASCGPDEYVGLGPAYNPYGYGGVYGDTAGNLMLIQQGLGQATSPYGGFPRPTICSPSGRSVICY